MSLALDFEVTDSKLSNEDEVLESIEFRGSGRDDDKLENEQLYENTVFNGTYIVCEYIFETSGILSIRSGSPEDYLRGGIF